MSKDKKETKVDLALSQVNDKRKKVIENIKSKLSLEEIKDLYDIFGVDDQVVFTEDGILKVKAFANKPQMDGLGSKPIELFASEKYAESHTRGVVQSVFELFTSSEERAEPKAKTKPTHK